MDSLSSIWKRSGGLGAYLAWVYCSFFSCGLVRVVSILRSVERVWVFAAVALAVTSVAMIVVRMRVSIANKRVTGYTAALLSAAGSVLIWVSFLGPVWNIPVAIAGGSLAGVGMSLQALVWIHCLSGFDVARVEGAVPISFALAFAVYFVSLAIKGPMFVVVMAVLPWVSMGAAFRNSRIWQCPLEQECTCGAARKLAPKTVWNELRSMGGLLLIYGLLWCQVAAFRVISSPDAVGDRFLHYLVPFSCSFVLAIALFFVCIRFTRFLNYSLLYRIALPSMIISYSILFMGPFGFYDHKSAAYTLNFVAMFLMQLTVWTVTPKKICRMGLNPVVAMCGLNAAEGVGVAMGLAITLPAVDNEESVMGVTLLLLGLAAAASMAFGLKTDIFFTDKPRNPLFVDESRGRKNASADLPSSDDEDDRREPVQDLELDDLFEREAEALSERYGLTARETEIATYLLAGRSRPYIRDELVISLNTVHAHTRNIYSKCGVHTQQELMDLMRRG